MQTPKHQKLCIAVAFSTTVDSVVLTLVRYISVELGKVPDLCLYR